MSPQTEFHRERNKVIVQLAKEGMTQEDIAERVGLSRQRVHQICRKAGLVKRVDYAIPLQESADNA